MNDLILGIDIGGTKIFHGLVDSRGNIVSEIKKESTPKTTPEIEEILSEIINSYKNETSLAGIATAGAVNLENNKILSSTANLPAGYSNIDFQKLSSKVKIYIENDANASCYAEYKIGVSKGFSNSIVLTLGTGVGGGIIVNDTLLKGKSGAAGEMHFKINTNECRKCTCGAWDCFEAYGSGRGLKLTYQEFKDEDIDTYEIIKRFNKGDSTAKKALLRWNLYIAMGALSLNNIFDTQIIAFTGSMAQFIDVDFIQEYVNKYTVTTETKIAHCKAGNYAGLIGAALIAKNK